MRFSDQTDKIMSRIPLLGDSKIIAMRLENIKDRSGIIIVAETPIDDQRLSKTSDTEVVNDLLSELEINPDIFSLNILGVRGSLGLNINRNERNIKEDLKEFFVRVAEAFSSKN